MVVDRLADRSGNQDHEVDLARMPPTGAASGGLRPLVLPEKTLRRRAHRDGATWHCGCVALVFDTGPTNSAAGGTVPLPAREAGAKERHDMMGREIQSVLALWRAAERHLAAATPGTFEFEQARADVIRAKSRYLSLASAALREEAANNRAHVQA
jgi:hypothetical protein